MKKLKSYRYIIVLALVLTESSCKKLLEIPPNPANRISTEQAFSDSSNVLNVISGIYKNFQIVDDGAAPSFFNGGVGIYPGMSADELINIQPALKPYQTPYYTNSLLPTDGYLSYMWTEAYTTLYGINSCIKNTVASTGISSSFKNQVEGEMRTMRSWIYFNLVNMFGGVPLVTGTDFTTNAKLPRETEAKMYEFITADLETAVTLLKADYPSAGRARPNLFTAMALLAKVYLYQKNWQKAAQLSGEVIGSGLYALEPDVNNVFLHGSTEAIWQYPGDGASFAQTNDAPIFLPPSYDPNSIGWYDINPSLLNAFEPDDQRLANWVIEKTIGATTYHYPYKYKNNEMDNVTTQEDYTFFRLAEQYLIRAEAEAELNQSTAAVDDLNMIRQRAGLTDVSFSDKETLLNDIMQERRVELFCEWGHRWFDLKRTDRANTVLGTKPNWQPTDMLYPIPLSEMKLNPFLKQNPGY